MAISNEDKKEAGVPYSKLNVDTKAVPVEREEEDLVTGNEYLKKEQQKYFANQWVLQQNYYADCGAVTKITLDKEYEVKGISREEQTQVRIKSMIYEKLNIANTLSIGILNYSVIGNVEKFEQQIADLQKAVDKAEEDYITYGAKVYFGIEKDIADKYFETITPYVIGRKYINDIKIFGTSADKQRVTRFTRDLREKRYYS